MGLGKLAQFEAVFDTIKAGVVTGENSVDVVNILMHGNHRSTYRIQFRANFPLSLFQTGNV
ncbi:hypothetical protein ADU59_27110 [Pararhizobium polonicum]|uniref:Uncharacterized protein n=1 Tax=Pararhizobium polonicum TaxID=1612624 RepID=A0A1C7NTV3_9HYPH|nr:hypothetical protein ADU59_27110 [Pararhizobium polonicum]